MRRKWAYYNEFDPNAAAWLRELIKLGAIMDGEVDERSIKDVRAEDVGGFVRCHFFAGIGGWDIALRQAGWADDRNVWTGSCPCQAFSCAGQQKGFADERDLWPAFFGLVRECRPDVVFGEQVKNAVKFGWLDRLYADMEGEGYACGSAVLGAHSAGADHIRQRIYWVADAEHAERGTEHKEFFRAYGRDGLGGSGELGRLGNATVNGREMRERILAGVRGEGSRERRESGGMGDTCGEGLQGYRRSELVGISEGREDQERHVTTPNEHVGTFWSNAVPHLCKDGKWRRLEPSIPALAASVSRGVGYGGDPRLAEYVNSTTEARVMRLKGYGNAICVDTASMFIKADMDVHAENLTGAIV